MFANACCTDEDNHLSYTAALQQIETTISPITTSEQVPLRAALNRVLAEDILSRYNLPSHANSAMDGYAVASADLPATGHRTLTVVGTSFAGKPYIDAVTTGHCVRIFTGALLPPGTDTVIMQEHVTVVDDKVTLPTGARRGHHVRVVGENVAVGQRVLAAGKCLTPADIGLLAALGVAEIKVIRRVRVAIFSTGDELCAIGETPQLGQIYDSNRYILHGLLTNLGIDSIDLGIVRDDPRLLEQACLNAADGNDMIITSGGVSVGAADYVTDVLQRLGHIHFWKVAIKPGRPLTFGKIRNSVFFGLPGNPVSATVTFYQFVRPALHRLSGQTPLPQLQLTVPCSTPLKKSPGRLEFQRGILETDAHGQLVVRSTGQQESGMLVSMSQANCFIILPLESGNVAAGSPVLVEPF